MPVIFWIALLWLGEGPHFKALPPPFRIQNSNSLPPLQLGCIQMISILPGRPAAADFDWNEAFCLLLVAKFLWLLEPRSSPSLVRVGIPVPHSLFCFEYSPDLLHMCSKALLSHHSWHLVSSSVFWVPVPVCLHFLVWWSTFSSSFLGRVKHR